jgi:hypothetical protein
MKYVDLFITDKNEIEKIIQEANLEIDTTVIVSVNNIITKEFILPYYDDNVTETIDEYYCLPFLFCFYHYKSTVIPVIDPHEIRTKYQKKYDNSEEQQVVMRNLLLFLQGLSLEDICMIAKYHNLYYKNNIFRRVLFTPLNIYNGTPEGVPSDVPRATLPINQLKSTDIFDVRSNSNVHRCKMARFYLHPYGMLRHPNPE